MEYSKSKEGKNEFETNELSSQRGRHSTGKQHSDNPSALQGSLQRTADVEFGSQTSVTDKLPDFRTEMTLLKSTLRCESKFWTLKGDFPSQ